MIGHNFGFMKVNFLPKCLCWFWETSDYFLCFLLIVCYKASVVSKCELGYQNFLRPYFLNSSINGEWEFFFYRPGFEVFTKTFLVLQWYLHRKIRSKKVLLWFMLTMLLTWTNRNMYSWNSGVGLCCILPHTTWLPVSRKYKDAAFLKHGKTETVSEREEGSSSERTSLNSKTNFGRNTNSARLITLVGTYPLS